MLSFINDFVVRKLYLSSISELATASRLLESVAVKVGCSLTWWGASRTGFLVTGALNNIKFEPRHEKTGYFHMRKQRRRSASRLPRS